MSIKSEEMTFKPAPESDPENENEIEHWTSSPKKKIKSQLSSLDAKKFSLEKGASYCASASKSSQS